MGEPLPLRPGERCCTGGEPPPLCLAVEGQSQKLYRGRTTTAMHGRGGLLRGIATVDGRAATTSPRREMLYGGRTTTAMHGRGGLLRGRATVDGRVATTSPRREMLYGGRTTTAMHKRGGRTTIALIKRATSNVRKLEEKNQL